MHPHNHRRFSLLYPAIVLLAGSGAFLCPQAGQASGDAAILLRGRNVTESRLVEALTPSPAPVLTRSLKVSRVADTSQAVADAPAAKPSASLLITFETNSAQLTPPSRKQLDVVASALKNERLADHRFSIEGHADPRGSHEANLALSRQRAESVRGYLVASHGIAAQRLSAEGKGDTEPMNTAVAAAPENRRVTIVTQTNP